MMHGHWYTLQNNEKVGPFTFETMLTKIQNQELHSYDYAWGPTLEQWTPISEIPNFSTEQIIRLMKDPQWAPLINRRKNPRVALNLQVMGHDNQRLWTGHTQTLSMGGALVTLANPLLKVGQSFSLHFCQQNKLENSFNLQATVISKRLKRGPVEYNSPFDYAVRFTNELNEDVIQQFKQWISTLQHI